MLFVGVGKADVALPFMAVRCHAAAARIHFDNVIVLFRQSACLVACVVLVAGNTALVSLFRFGTDQCRHGG